MNNYVDMIYRLIKSRGTESYSLRKVTSSDFSDILDPSKGPTSTTADYSLYSFPDGFSSFIGYMSGQLNKELIKKGDILLHITPKELSVAPNQSDLIIKDIGSSTETWRIIEIFTYEIQDSVALYSLHIRK